MAMATPFRRYGSSDGKVIDVELRAGLFELRRTYPASPLITFASAEAAIAMNVSLSRSFSR